tara:strand:- start:170 stop:586 length:417 start_codon:yes stop_codon:yes gene_type:complete
MEYRKNGLNCLILCDKKNSKKYEKYIYQNSETESEYKNNILSVIKYISDKIPFKDIINMIENNKIGFNSESYNKYRNNMKEHDHFIVNPFTVEEGVVECGKCGCNKTYSYAKQIRGGDEGTSIFSICSKCQHQWVSGG